jgi:hypothetical protein
MPRRLRLATSQWYLIFRGRDRRLLTTRSGYFLVALDSTTPATGMTP